MTHTLIQHIRNSDKTPCGVVVATIRPSDNKIGIDFSAVKPDSGDKFDIEESDTRVCLTCGAKEEVLYERGYCYECMKCAEDWANSSNMENE